MQDWYVCVIKKSDKHEHGGKVAGLDNHSGGYPYAAKALWEYKFWPSREAAEAYACHNFGYVQLEVKLFKFEIVDV